MSAYQHLSSAEFGPMTRPVFGLDPNRIQAAADNPLRADAAEATSDLFFDDARRAYGRAQGLSGGGFGNPGTIRGQMENLSRALDAQDAHREGDSAVSMGVAAHAEVYDETARMNRVAGTLRANQDLAVEEIKGHPDSLVSSAMALRFGRAGTAARSRLAAELGTHSLN